MDRPTLASGLTPASRDAVLAHLTESGRSFDEDAHAELARWLVGSPSALDYAQRHMGICSDALCNQPIVARCALCSKAICADHSEDDYWQGKICHNTEHYENRMRPGQRHTHSGIG